MLSCLVPFAALLVSACAPPPMPLAVPPPPPGSVPRVVPKPVDCTETLTDAAYAQEALDAAEPGTRFCVLGRYVKGGELRLTRSGTSDEPIELVSDGATLSEIDVDADNVLVAGFNTEGGAGISATGTNITIRDNDVRGAALDGIRCSPCADSLVEANTVQRADGTGVLISGENVTLRGNDISGSVRRGSTDADGIRFFGIGLKIMDNSVHDVSQQGYPVGRAPHPDCFETFDRGSPTSYDVLITGNECVNVDAQCLVASGTDRRNAGVPAGRVAIRFVDNYCQSGARQAVYLEGYPNVEIRGNTFSSDYTTAVLAEFGATNVVFADNTLVGDFAPFDVDRQSRLGFLESGNKSR